MSTLRLLSKIVAGSGAGIAVITALPVFGAVGTITAVGTVVGSLGGALAGAIDEWTDRQGDRPR